MTVLRFATHLWFDDAAVPAAELYTSLLPDSHIDRVTTTPPGVPGGREGEPFFVDLTLVGQQYTFLGPRPPVPARREAA